MVISLFANLIDNAFCACKKNAVHKVHLEACVIKSVLMIHIKNTIEPGIHVNLEKSSKEQAWKHGYGLRTIKEILLENNGSLSYFQKKDTFFQDVRLYLSQNSSHNASWFKKVFIKEKGSGTC
jgi:sensor histidine kinase regulating citrate/malate metabolism